jgi:hypothetical protein
MHPNNETIDPTMANVFSFIFSGVKLTSYTYTFYNLFNGTAVLTRTTSGATRYDGDVIYENIPSSLWGIYTNHQLSYDVHLFGENFNCSGTATDDELYIPGANYGFAERVFIGTLSFLGVQDVYLIPSGTQDYYYAFLNVEAAKNALQVNRVVVQTSLSGVSTKAHAYSEQIPIQTALQPTFTLGVVTAQSGTHTVTPSYSQANGYALNSYTFYLYDVNGVELLTNSEVFSSNAKYDFQYLIDGQQYQVRFTGKSVLNQYVDTGKIAMNVTYAKAFTNKTIPITGTNECQYGRVKVNIPSHSPSFTVVEVIGGDTVNHTFTLVNTLIYRKEISESSVQLIAVADPMLTSYNDYMAQNGKVYDYSIAFYGTLDTGEYSGQSEYLPGYNVISNTNHTGNIIVKYYGWFLIDLDTDKSYKFDALFEGGDLTQEDDFTKYKTNLSYSAYSVGNTKAVTSSNRALVSVDNLNVNFHDTNDLLQEIADLVSTRNTHRKIVKDRRNPTRIFPVFTYGFIQNPLNNAIGYQPYVCSFSFDQIGDVIQ